MENAILFQCFWIIYNQVRNKIKRQCTHEIRELTSEHKKKKILQCITQRNRWKMAIENN